MSDEHNDAEPPAASPPSPAATNQIPWPVTVVVTWLFGLLAGVVLTYAVGWVPVSVVLPSQAPPPTSTAPPAPPEPVVGLPPPVRDTEVQAKEAAAAAERSTPVDAQTEVGPPPRDPSEAVMQVAPIDEEGDDIPATVAVLVTERRALVPLSAIVSARSANLKTAEGALYTVTGVVAHSTPHDLALVELAAPIDYPTFAPRTTRPPPGQATILHEPGGRIAGRRTAILLSPTEPDLLSGGPRLAATPEAPFAGAAVDDRDQLVALFPRAGEPGIPVDIAGSWINSTASVPFDAFLRVLGPGTPAARQRRAKKLLEGGRFEEAAREYLVITGEEPRLIDEVGDDMTRATSEAARKYITAGNAAAAYSLLNEALYRLPRRAELWALQGRALALFPDLAAAIDSFQSAARLDPGSRKAYINEARGLLLEEVNALRAQQRDGEALRLLLEHRGSFPDDGQLRLTAGDLLLRGKRFIEAAQLFEEAAKADAQLAGQARREAERARDLAGGPGAIVVDYPPGSTDIVLDCRIDGGTAVNLRLDASEELVVLPKWAIDQAGYSLVSVIHTPYLSSSGSVEAPAFPVLRLSARGVTQERVQVVVIDDYGGGGADGVLGRSFLSRFRRVEDASLGRLVLYPR